MSKSFTTITTDIAKALGTLRKDIPETMQNFQALSKAAMAPGVLSELDKELIALAIGVTSRCDGCIGFHVRTLVKMGMTFEELNEILGIAVYMGGGPSLMYAANAVAAFKEFSPSTAE